MLTTVSEGVDWSDVMHRLRRDGFARLANALDSTACRTLAEAAPEPWHQLPPEEGAVRQNGQATGGPLADGHAVVRQFADHVVSAITAATSDRAGPPPFNEVTWTLYPEGTGHITAHRDPVGVGGVIAIATLRGTASFGVQAPTESVEWFTEAGDVVLLCGNGWPDDETRCPVHVVGPPVGGDRMILTLRHNTGGAGAAYFTPPA
jgi:hypothetical protein